MLLLPFLPMSPLATHILNSQDFFAVCDVSSEMARQQQSMQFKQENLTIQQNKHKSLNLL